MARDYTITPSINAGRRDSLAQYWTNCLQGDNGGTVVGHTKLGYTSVQYRLVNFLISSADLAQFTGKTITGIKLRIKVQSGTLGSTSYPYCVRYKYNNVATTTSSSDAWASGNADGSAYDDTDLATWDNGQGSGQTDIATNTVHDFDLGTTLPSYGYVLAGTRNSNAYMILAEASIIVTTNETKKTLSYNANGGVNAPASQEGWSVGNVTLTVTNSTPTRTGFEFVKWNTKSDGTGTNYNSGASITISSNTTLYAVWNALKSTLNTISSVTIGNSVSISWTAKGSFQHKLTVSLGSASSGEITINAGTNSYSYTTPSSWLNQLPTTTSGSATATLQTLVDGVVIGTDSKTFTANVASNVKPTIGSVSTQKVNSNATVAGWDIYLQSYSQVKITASSLSAGTGATLASIRFVGANMDTTVSVNGTSANATSNIITASGSQTYTLTLTDSRGRTATTTTSISVTAYEPPTVTWFNAWRCDSDGTVNAVTGESLSAQAFFTYTQVGNNAVTNSLSYKKTTEQYYTTAGTDIGTGVYTVFNANNADMASTYNIQFTISDSLLNSNTYYATVSSVVGIAYGLKNDRARFGGAVRQAGLEVDWDAQFDNNVDVTDRLTAKRLRAKGTSAYPFSITDENDVTYMEFIKANSQGQFSVYDAGTERNYVGQGRFSTYNTSGVEVDRICDAGSFFGSDVNHTGTLTVNNKPVVLTVNSTSPDSSGNVNVTGGSSILRSAEGSIGSVGWYRICSYNGTSSSNATGGHGVMVRFHIQKNTASENHSITLRMSSSSNIIWCDESSHSGTQLIDKIRYNTSGNYGYVDIHFTGTASRGVGVDFEVHESNNRSTYLPNWEAVNFTAVADAPTGETTIVSHNFSADAFYPNQTIYNQYGDLNNTGYRPYKDGGTVAVPSGSWTSLCSLELTAGRWLVYATGRFDSSNGTIRAVRVGTTANTSSSTVQFSDARVPISGSQTFCKSMDMVLPTVTTTYYLNAYQDSGASLNAVGRLYAVQIC